MTLPNAFTAAIAAVESELATCDARRAELVGALGTLRRLSGTDSAAPIAQTRSIAPGLRAAKRTNERTNERTNARRGPDRPRTGASLT